MSKALIAIQYPDGMQEKRPLQEGSYLIGRNTGDIVLPDPDVSAHHARLEVRAGQVYVTDLESTNGTIGLNNERVRPGQHLNFGESVRVGRCSITVVTEAPKGLTRAMVQFPDMAAPAPSAQELQVVNASVSSSISAELSVGGRQVVAHKGRAVKMSTSGYSATHVSGGGSTTTVYSSGYVHTTQNATTSHTTHHTLQELWLRTQDGRDVPFILRDADVEVLEGHDVTMLCREADGKPVRLLNHTTKFYYRIDVKRYALWLRILDCVWPFAVAYLWLVPYLNVVFSCYALWEVTGRAKGWAVASPLFRVAALVAVALVGISYTGLATAYYTQPFRGYAEGPTLLGRPEWIYFAAVFYYQVRNWNRQQTASALDQFSGRSL